MLRTLVVLTCLGALLASCGTGSDGSPDQTGKPSRPNILLIITDDQRFDTVGDFMPETQKRIFDDGVTFTNAFATTPLCCPSRASILTGMYAHKHGVHENADPLNQPTFVQALDGAGYYTGLVGKYLNSYDSNQPPRPEFDYWVATPGSATDYYDVTMNVNGRKQVVKPYVTGVLKDYALDFLKQADDRSDPFLLIFAPNAPHPPAIPAPEDVDLYGDLPEHRPPSYNVADPSGKPIHSSLTGEERSQLDTFRLDQLRSLKAVDRGVAELLDSLEDAGRLDSTAVIFLSDNGYLWGEHSLEGKVFVYEPSVRVPFAVRYPKAFPEGEVDQHLVANIDIAPTILELAGLPAPPTVDGRSLLALLNEPSSWRTDLLLEGWYAETHYSALRTERYKYVETDGTFSELYDLGEDPDELENRAADPAYADVIEQLSKRLDVLRGFARPASRQPTPTAP